jgi:hypothetical protein
VTIRIRTLTALAMGLALESAGQKPASSGKLTAYLDAISNTPSFTEYYGTSLAFQIIALARAGRTIPAGLYQAAITWSIAEPSPVEPTGFFDTDTVGLMLTALSYVNIASPEKTQAIAALEGHLARAKVPNGPGWAGWDPSAPLQVNVATTAWVAPGAWRTGNDALKAQAVAAQSVFVTHQRSDGAITPGTPGSVDMLETSHSVLPLLGLRSYDNAGSPSTAARPVPVQQFMMWARGTDSYTNIPIAPTIVLNGVTSGTLSAQLLGVAPLISGSGGPHTASRA